MKFEKARGNGGRGRKGEKRTRTERKWVKIESRWWWWKSGSNRTRSRR